VNWADGSAGITDSYVASAPTTLTAKYRAVSLFESPALWIGLIALIAAAILVAFFLLRRRKKEPEEDAPSSAGASAASEEDLPPPGEELQGGAAPVEDARIAKLTEAYQSGRISKEQYQANVKRIRGNA